MKKVCVVFILIVCIIIESKYYVEAYSTSNYSIDIPSTYNKVGENSFTNENGKNINIQIVPYGYSTIDNLYTEEHLNELVKGLFTEVDKYRDEMKRMLQEKNNNYGAGLTDEEINEYVKSFKCDSVEKKEITTFTKNNYKGFHIVAKYTMDGDSYYVDQYIVVSGKKIYTLSITCSNFSEVNSTITKNIVNSFTINNFQEVKGTGERVLDKIFTSFFSCLILCGIAVLIGKIRRDKESYVKENEILTDNIEKSSIKLNDDIKVKNVKCEEEKSFGNKGESEVSKKFCTNCGKEINNNWAFCNYCGFKLK